MMQARRFGVLFQIGTEPSSTLALNPRSFFQETEFSKGDPMGPSISFRATALIVEDDPTQREMICLLLEESDYNVIQCESAEAAERVIEKIGGCLSLLMTDVNLAGRMNGVELAHIAKERNPTLDVVVTSGRPLKQALPLGAKFWPKPWAALDVLREAQMAQAMTSEAMTRSASRSVF
jgi:two-component system cell cycle response regulator CpdR